MGMFDSVYVKCPNCETEMEFQSKAGDCQMQGFDYRAVPVAIAEHLDGKVLTCRSCNHDILIELAEPIRKVAMRVRDIHPMDEPK